MKAKVAQNNYLYIQDELNKLQELIQVAASDNTVVSSIKNIVPEFISQNSFFEKLDIKSELTMKE
jgi:hypothetical protein